MPVLSILALMGPNTLDHPGKVAGAFKRASTKRWPSTIMGEVGIVGVLT